MFQISGIHFVKTVTWWLFTNRITLLSSFGHFLKLVAHIIADATFWGFNNSLQNQPLTRIKHHIAERMIRRGVQLRWRQFWGLSGYLKISRDIFGLLTLLESPLKKLHWTHDPFYVSFLFWIIAILLRNFIIQNRDFFQFLMIQ